MFGCIWDFVLDVWGWRVIINKKLGSKGKDLDIDLFGELIYLLEFGFDCIGVLDFQCFFSEYVLCLVNNVLLEELL